LIRRRVKTGVEVLAPARVRLESEGFRVFSVTPPKTRGIAAN